MGEVTLKGVGHGHSAGMEFVAPGEFATLPAAPGGPLPLLLRGQLLTDPAGVGRRIGVGHMHHRVLAAALD